jgi:hypothetical protein
LRKWEEKKAKKTENEERGRKLELEGKKDTENEAYK